MKKNFISKMPSILPITLNPPFLHIIANFRLIASKKQFYRQLCVDTLNQPIESHRTAIMGTLRSQNRRTGLDVCHTAYFSKWA